jgi:hypothetical protein
LAALAFPWSALSHAGTPKVGTRHAKVHPSRNDFWSGKFQTHAEPLRHIRTIAASAPSAPALGPYAVAQAFSQMGFMERCFVALTVVGSLGVIAIVIWMLMH